MWKFNVFSFFLSTALYKERYLAPDLTHEDIEEPRTHISPEPTRAPRAPIFSV